MNKGKMRNMNSINATFRFEGPLILKMNVKIIRKIKNKTMDTMTFLLTLVKNSRKKTSNNERIIVISLNGE